MRALFVAGAIAHFAIGVCAVVAPRWFFEVHSSCVGVEACGRNSGDIGPSSCIGVAACLPNEADIGPNQCLGDFACSVN
jgi:hypothetical protein